MRILFFSVLLAGTAFCQTAPEGNIITFSPKDQAHCRVIQVNGKAFLESTYEGISVAVGMPENKGNGEFSVFVSVYQAGEGTAHVVPKDYSALFSDPDHTRFSWFDKAAETQSYAPAPPAPGGAGMSATSNNIDTSLMRGGPARSEAAGPSPSETLKGDNLPGNMGPAPPAQAPPSQAPAAPPAFLRAAKVKQGSRAAGLVYFRKPKGSKLQVNPSDMLAEIDIRVNGIVFRF